MDEKNFIKEKIVGQKISWKKKVVKALSFLFSGGVFGLGIFLVLFFLLPILPEKKEGKEMEKRGIKIFLRFFLFFFISGKVEALDILFLTSSVRVASGISIA